MTRIAIAGVVHETNTYCRDTTPTSSFDLRRGEAILRARGTESTAGGAIAACDRLGFEVVPLLIATAVPSGTIQSETYESFKQEILAGIEAAKPIDAVFLDLHGAGVVEHLEDLEGDLAVAVRNLVGEAVPITAVFDLHGNVTQTMADALDGVFACHQYPHVDLHERADEAIQLIDDMLKENFRPVIHVETLPMLLPTTTTFVGIGKSMLQEILEAELPDEVIDVSWFHGFPYADIKLVGVHIAVTVRGDRERAKAIARHAAESLWRQRDAFKPQSLSAKEAVGRAVNATEHPVIINETSDNCGGGTPGDGTHLLRAMLEAKLDKACFAFLVDPEVALQAHKAGVGNSIDVSLGGKTDDLHGDPLELNVYIKALHDGRMKMLAMVKGAPMHLGLMARLVVNGIDIVVASNRSQTFDIGPFLAVGIDVVTYPIVALKSSNHFRAGFQDIAGTIITADPPGLSTHRMETFNRRRAPGPVWPIDAAAEYSTS
ncbi:MAG: M81 family metallopeptidase [Pseudomonadales bacterium]